MTDVDKAIRAAKLTLGAVLDKRRAQTAKDRAGGQIAPSKYLPGVPRQFHADGGSVSDARTTFLAGNHPEVPDVLYHGTTPKIARMSRRSVTSTRTTSASSSRLNTGTTAPAST